MRFLELAARRHSCRAYRPDPVPAEALEHVLDAARLAPTACNRQPFRLVLIETAGREAELGKVYPKSWFAQAPWVIGICGVAAEAYSRADGRSYLDVDVAIAFDHLILAAEDEGLGTCWVGAFDLAAARQLLKTPAGVEPIAFTPLGYPADPPRAKVRRPLSELVLRGSF